MNYRILLLGGILAPLVYIAAVITGAALRPGYSHIANFVSELIESGAPNKALLNPLFAVYNLLTAAFAVGLLYAVSAAAPTAGRFNTGTLAAIVLLAEAVFGFVTIFFPQDPVGSPVTPTGTLHIVLAGLSSLTTMGAMLLAAIWLKNVPGLGAYSLYSYLSLAVVFISGGLAAYSGATHSPIAGLPERITIGAFLQWMLVMGIRLFGM